MGRQIVSFLQDNVGGGKPGVNIAPLQGQRLRDGQVAVGMDGGGVRFQRGHRVGYERQRPIIHAHQRGGLPGRIPVVRGHGGHFVPGKAHPGVQRQQIRGDADCPGVGRRNHRAHSGQSQSGAGVHVQHVGVGMGAAHDDAVQHSRQSNVRRVLGGAGKLVRQLPARHALPNGSQGRGNGNRTHNSIALIIAPSGIADTDFVCGETSGAGGAARPGTAIVGLVETGESRTPRPETSLSGYATSLFGALLSLSPPPADGILQQPADKTVAARLSASWGLHPGIYGRPLPGFRAYQEQT